VLLLLLGSGALPCGLLLLLLLLRSGAASPCGLLLLLTLAALPLLVAPALLLVAAGLLLLLLLLLLPKLPKLWPAAAAVALNSGCMHSCRARSAAVSAVCTAAAEYGCSSTSLSFWGAS
jgi:hypothetical protein